MLDYYDENADFSDRTLAIIIQIRIFERKVKTEKKLMKLWAVQYAIIRSSYSRHYDSGSKKFF